MIFRWLISADVTPSDPTQTGWFLWSLWHVMSPKRVVNRRGMDRNGENDETVIPYHVFLNNKSRLVNDVVSFVCQGFLNVP